MRIIIIGLLLLPIISGSKGENGSGRSFIHRPSDESSNDLSHYAEKILTSSLTTVFFPILYIIIFIVGVPTNAMALWVFIFRAKKRHPASIYMANLALADLLFAIWIPLKIAYHINGNNWIYGEGLCRVLVSFFYSNMYCSILFMTCLSVQRYWVIVNPMSHQRKNTSVAIGISISIWLLIVLSTIPLFMQKQTIHLAQLNITTCHDVLEEEDMTLNMFGYFLSMAIGAFFFPAILTIVAYVLMILTLTGSMKDDNIGKKRKKAIRLIIIVLVMYLVCFTPSNILLVIHYAQIRSNNDALYAVYITALCLSSLNSCIDPFVYYFVSQEFRDNVKNTLICRSNRTVERMRVSFSSMKYSKKTKSFTSSSQGTSNTTC
ncbi:coagulation factor II (thrombin) receptor-like 1, tandem duplicate 2 isoform X2 [Erpetoichthys calabaricus]|uniref:coagulation factor II (thrombin) receptor-like 1, tandem duplicate 2 isoform X2 n=1 Tax=Erpetoichthys calabaricus TaxID=27687 RepID=UPI0022346E8A|nr:coagulation factor II (thrombin) receptor-like 1, tandem duplicate 2 isoform X2 [Erpetoichthys calabaricus]